VTVLDMSKFKQIRRSLALSRGRVPLDSSYSGVDMTSGEEDLMAYRIERIRDSMVRINALLNNLREETASDHKHDNTQDN
jgi:hypothetical protein